MHKKYHKKFKILDILAVTTQAREGIETALAAVTTQAHEGIETTSLLADKLHATSNNSSPRGH